MISIRIYLHFFVYSHHWFKKSYMSCVEVWIDFILDKLTKKEVNAFLGDVIKHVQPDRIFEKFYPQLQLIAKKIVLSTIDFSVLFSIVLNSFFSSN